MTNEINRTPETTEAVSAEALAHMGDGQIAYLKHDPLRGCAGTVSASP